MARARGSGSLEKKAGLAAGAFLVCGSGWVRPLPQCGRKLGVWAGEEVASDRKTKWARAGWREGTHIRRFQDRVSR